MRIAMIVGATLGLAGSGAIAADNEAGVRLAPSEAVGVWTLETNGRRVCTVTLQATKVGAGYGARSEPACTETLGGVAASWQPTNHGMRLVTADGASLLGFSRWSNSLFVSHSSSGVDVQLRRGT